MSEQLASQTREPLNLGLVIFAPVSSVPGSASVFYLQPLLTGKVFAGSGVLIGAELFLFLAQKFFGLEGLPIWRGDGLGGFQCLTIPVSELSDFLYGIACSGGASVPQDGVSAQFITPTTTEAPLIVGVAVYGDYSTVPFSPLLFFTVPLFTLPGIRGSLPLLILITLTTIFVRAVVPPSTTGSQPLEEGRTSSLPFKPEDLLHLLQRFGKYFAK